MVSLQRMVVLVIMRSRRLLNGEPPEWAVTLQQSVNKVQRMVSQLMEFDTQVVARLVAAAGALAEQSKKVAAERDAYKAAAEQNGADLESVRATLAEERAAEAQEDQSEAAATDVINAAADSVLALVNGPETPDVAPVPVEDVPAVVNGDQPVEAPGGGEVVDSGSADPVAADPAPEADPAPVEDDQA